MSLSHKSRCVQSSLPLGHSCLTFFPLPEAQARCRSNIHIVRHFLLHPCTGCMHGTVIRRVMPLQVQQIHTRMQGSWCIKSLASCRGGEWGVPCGEGATGGCSLGDSGRWPRGDTFRLATNTPACTAAAKSSVQHTNPAAHKPCSTHGSRLACPAPELHAPTLTDHCACANVATSKAHKRGSTECTGGLSKGMTAAQAC